MCPITSHVSALLANTLYSCILHQHIACQYPLISIAASHTSALLANTHSSLLSPLMPMHCLPIPAPIYSCLTPVHCLSITTPLLSHLVLVHYPPNTCSSIIAPCASTLLAKFLFTAILKSSTSTLLNYKSHPITFFHTLS
jgi:hypothetical protein